MRLVDARQVDWQNRAHFLAMAARVMRRVPVDAARRRGYQKRGGNAVRVSLTGTLRAAEKSHDVVALDDALRVTAEGFLYERTENTGNVWRLTRPGG